MKIKNWMTADCETDPFNGREIAPFIWATHDGNNTRVYEGPRATANFISELQDYDGIAYAHNGGKFDWMFSEILGAINDDEPIMLINGRIAKAKIGKCEIRDSWLCLPAPLVAFEKSGFNYEWLTKENRDNFMPQIREYIKSDVINLYEPLNRFFGHHGQALTQAGAALKTWEEMGGEKRRYGPTHDALFRPFYFGGRTEVFKYANGERGPFSVFDVNSAYPYAMTFDHPVTTQYIRTRNLSKIVGPSFWRVRAISRGALPFRKDDGGICFPNENTPRDYSATGWELLTGLETGTLEILDGEGYVPIEFETMAPYVNHFIKDKEKAEKAGDKIGRLLAKIFLNSLYGKYAANPDEYRDYKIGGHGGDGWQFYQLILTSEGARPIFWKPSDRAQYFDVALAASITGHARANLWRAICGARDVLYCDTDSIICRDGGNIELGDKLGQWDCDGIDQAWIAGKKLYVFEMSDGSVKTASKGVCATPEEIKRVCAGETVTIKNDAPTMKIDGRQLFIQRDIKRT